MRKKVLLAVVISLIFTLFLAGCTGGSSEQKTDDTEVYVKAISVDSSTIPSSAYVGEFDVSDLRLNVIYSDDKTTTVSVEKNMIMTDSLSKLNKEGTHVIKIFYENCQTSFNIKLVAKAKTNYTLRIYGGKPIAINDAQITDPIEVKGEYFEAAYEEGTVVTIEWIQVEGNSFSEWTDSNNPQFRDTQSITKATMNMNHVYRASSSPAVMTVNFETNCSTSVGSKKTDMLYESDIPELKKEGYVFDGWTTEKLIGEEAIDATAQKITFPYAITVNNCTLYGTWRRLGLEYIAYTNPATGKDGYKVSSYVKNDKELIIPERYNGLNVIAIDSDALSGATALESLFIPATIEEIGEGFVRNCARLKEIDVGINAGRFSVIDDVLYNYNMDELIAYPAGKLTPVFSLDGIKVIHDYAFRDALVGGIVLPASLREIGSHAFDSSHVDYVDLTAVNPTENGFKIGSKAFNENIGVIVMSSQYLSAYNGMSALSEFESKFTTDADSVSNIGINEQGTLLYKEIRNENSSSEFIETTIEIIGADRSMTGLIIPVTLGNYDVSSIGVKAFNGCIYLSSVTIPSESKLERILEDAFTGTPYIEKLNSKTIIANDILYKYLGEKEYFELPKSVSRIAERAFMNNTYLKRLDLSKNNKLNYIGPYAFYGCVNLVGTGTKDNPEEGFCVKKDLVTVANYAFANSGIIEFGFSENSNSLKYIGKEAFANCYYIKKVTIGAATEEIDSTAFLFCDALKEFNVIGENKAYVAVNGVLYFSDNSDGKYNTLFMYPAGRMDTEYKVNSSVVGADESSTEVTYISDYAFFRSNVAAIYIPKTIKTLSSKAIYVPGLVYVNFESINDGITYEDLFITRSNEYEKYQPEYVIAPAEDKNIDTFFGNDTKLKNNVLITKFNEELVLSEDKSLILRITDSLDGKKASVVRSDRSLESIEIGDEIIKNDNRYSITEIEGYAFFGRYLTKLTLGNRLSKLADYSLKYAENLVKIYVGDGIHSISASDNTFGDKFDNGMFVYVSKDSVENIKESWKLSSYKYIIDIETGLPKATFGYAEGEEPDDGTGPVDSVSGEITAELVTENMPVRKGYSFEGWLDDEDNLIDYPYVIPYNIELKCKWKPAEFRVIFNMEKQVNFEGEKERTINYGESYKFPVPEYSDGSKNFLYWKTSEGVKFETEGSWEPSFSDAVVNLYAEWEVRKFTLIYDIAVGGETSYQVSYDDDYTLGIPQKTGYAFKGWALDHDGTVMLTNAEGKSLLRWGYTDSDEVDIYSVWEATYVTVNLYFDANALFKTVTVKFGESFSFPYEGISDESWAQKKSIFCGWYADTAEGVKRYTDENGDGLFKWEDGQETDLYAQWPIEISKEEDLHNLSDFSASVILKNDIEVTKPIGSGEKPFNGIFIGNGKKVTFKYTVSADTESDGFIGLFAHNTGTIKDLIAEIKITVEATDKVTSDILYIGAITGLNEGKIINSTVNGVALTAEICVNVTKTVTKAYIGGYAGKNEGGVIKNVSVNLNSFAVNVNGVKYNRTTHADKLVCGTIVGSFDGGSIGTSSADDPDKSKTSESFNYYYTEDDDAFKDTPCGENVSGTTINIGVSASKKSL